MNILSDNHNHLLIGLGGIGEKILNRLKLISSATRTQVFSKWTPINKM